MRTHRRNNERGLSLIVTLVIAAGASVLVGGVLFYTASQATLARRIGQYETSLNGAVAATEKVVTRITKDFLAGGEPKVVSSLNSYSGMVPTAQDLTASVSSTLNTFGLDGSDVLSTDQNPVQVWTKFDFTDAQGSLNRTHVECVADWSYRELRAKFPGLRGHAANYCVISNVREKDRSYQIVSSVRQDVQIASVPLCQFQFFYVPDMELNLLTPGFNLNGRVHCNGTIYLNPGTDLMFRNHITASRRIVHGKHPADPENRPLGKVRYRGEREVGMNTLNLAIGTNAGPLQLREILEAPEPLENPASLIAQERFYNKADLIIIVSNDFVTARSGPYNGGGVTIPWLEQRGIVTRDGDDFYEQRQCEDLSIADVDLARFMANYDDLTRLLGRPPKTLWIADFGDHRKKKDKEKDDPADKDKGKGNDDKENDSPLDPNKGKGNDDKISQGAASSMGSGIVTKVNGTTGAVRLRNGANLPAVGLTIATPNPLYIEGSLNLGGAPFCAAADAVTVLSGNWSDLNSGRDLSTRIASDTTINGVIITGVVPTANGAYSGGAENALRLMEDWTGKTLRFNGSIIVLYYSKVADASWGGPNVYAPPRRAWSFDPKLGDSTGIPPSMPAARTVFRGDWRAIKPHSKS